MPITIQLDEVPSGYALSSVRNSESVQAVLKEFTSSEDGAEFVGRLEGWPSFFLIRLGKPWHNQAFWGGIDHLLEPIRIGRTNDT